MASAAEQLASQFNLSAFAKATELKKRIGFTLMALIVYRLGTYLPLGGIDNEAIRQIFEGHQGGGGIEGMLNMFSGGALGRMSIFALNIMPYISAAIIMQLLSATSPKLKAMRQEGESGRKKINQFTRIGTVILAAAQGFGLAVGLSQNDAVVNPGWYFNFTTMVTLTGGTVFLMWLGEQITARGVGNGISLIIFAGIIAELPQAVVQLLTQTETGQIPLPMLLGIALMVVAVITFIVFMERAQRRVIVQYPKRQVGGNRMAGGQSTHLPLKINTAGVIPPIFASSLLLMPMAIAGFLTRGGEGAPSGFWSVLAPRLTHGEPTFMVLYAILIAFFCFFYTSLVFNPDETAENLRKNGGFIPGIRPGKNTAHYLGYILNRITVIGAAYLVLVCLLPEVLIGRFDLPFYFGGTSLLIVVSVTMDTVGQIHSHLLAHQYEGLIKKAKLRGRRG